MHRILEVWTAANFKTLFRYFFRSPFYSGELIRIQMNY